MPRPSSKLVRGKGKAKATPSASPPFLTLALELREGIYAHVLSTDASTLFHMSIVNRQLSREIKPFLYRQTLTFDGQSELFAWIGQIDRNYLPCVEDIRFKLHDIDPDQIVGALGKRLQQANITKASGSRGPDTPDNPYYEACRADLRQVGAAFRLLPNVKSLAILSATERDPKPHPRTQLAFAKLVGQCFRKLQHLVSDEDQFPIDFISSKPELRSLRLPATTSSSDDETEGVFTSLSLTELEICRFPHHTLSAEDGWGCITAILETLSPLRSLTLFEQPGRAMPNLASEVFVESDAALRRHRNSLRTLKLLAKPDYRPDDSGGTTTSPISHCAAFLDSASSLTHIEFTDHWMPLYAHLPRTTRTVVWRLDGSSSPPNACASIHRLNKMMAHAVQVQGKPGDPPTLPNLADLVIYTDVWFRKEGKGNGDGDGGRAIEKALVEGRERLRRVGVRLCWRGWEGPMRL